MIPLTDEAITRIEHRVMAYTVLVFGVLSGIGSILQISFLQNWTTDVRVVVPVLALFLYTLTRHSLKVSEDLATLKKKHSPLEFQKDIEKTHGSMWERARANGTKRVLATYLNPDAFLGGDVDKSLKPFYEQAEKFECAEYKRIFGIYPNTPAFRAKRAESVAWLRGHRERTRKLISYEPRFVELEFQAAEMWIDDSGINFSFPSARVRESGWATSDEEAVRMAEGYFYQLWSRAKPIDDLFVAEAGIPG